MKPDRRRVMLTAHTEWRGTRHKPGRTFGQCLKLAWIVERQRLAGPQYYQTPDGWKPPEVLATFAEISRQMAALGASLRT